MVVITIFDKDAYIMHHIRTKYYSVVPSKIGFWVESNERLITFELKDEYDIKISGPEGTDIILVRDGKLLF